MARLLTINCGARSDRLGDWRDRVASLGAIVDTHAVDVIALQAVDAEMIEALGRFEFAYRAATVAIASQMPLTNVAEAALERLDDPDDRNDRLLLRATTAGMTVAVAHFSWVERLATRNTAQAVEALASSGDCLLVGDMNQPPGAAPLATLAEAGFTDSWPRLRGTEPGATFDTSVPSTRIDYVWERSARSRVERIEIVGGQGDAAISDHFGVLAHVL